MDTTQRIDAIFFDLYGTVVIDLDMARANREWTTRLGERFRSYGAEFTTEETLFRTFWSKPMPDKKNDETPFMRRLSDLAVELGGEIPLSELEELADELCDVWQKNLPLATDAHDVFSTLRKNHRVGVISNYGHPPHVKRYLKKMGIADLSDTILVSGDYPFAKPDPRLLLEACNDLDINPVCAMYVGDSIVDYRAARDAGMIPILIRRHTDRVRWPDDGTPSRFTETDKELEEQIAQGQLVKIKSLTKILHIVEELNSDQ